MRRSLSKRSTVTAMSDRFAPVFAAEAARRGLGDAQLAAIFETSAATIQRWRTGRIVPGVDRVGALAGFLDLRRSDVLALLQASQPTQPQPVRHGLNETFGGLLQRLENERGWSPADAIAATGIDRSRYYRLRSDRTTPRLADIPALAAALHVPEDQLVMSVYRTELRHGSPSTTISKPVHPRT